MATTKEALDFADQIEAAAEQARGNILNDTPHVYAAISACIADLAKIGIAKDSRNSQQNYNFRGIDAVYNALAPIIAKHGLVIVPRIISRSQTERETQKGGVLFYVVVEAEFDFVSAKDGSSHTAKTYGEAMDSADKATNKAMSAAYKYAAFQTFCIPTEGDNDADGTTHDVKPKQSAKPEGYDNFAHDFSAAADNGLETLREAFKHAKPAHREYLTKHDGEFYNRTRAKAEAASKKAKEVAA